MKNRILLLLSLFLFSQLASCDSSNKYELKVEGDDFSSLIECPEDGYYFGGEKLQIISYTLMDINLYVYLNGTQVSYSQEDNRWIYEFTMPSQDSELIITTDEYIMKDEYSFSEVFPEVANFENSNISEIQINKTNDTLNPLLSNEYIVSNDKEDITNVLKLFNSKLVKTDSYSVRDSIEYKLNIILDDYSYYYLIADGYIFKLTFSSYTAFKIVDFDSKYLELSSPFSYFSFPENISKADVYIRGYDSDNYFLADKTFNDVDKLFYIPYGDSSLTLDPKAYLSIDQFDPIYLYSDKLFSYQDNYYEIIGQIDFSSLFNDF